MKIVQHPELRAFVTKHLLDDQTPEAIAGRLEQQTKLPVVSNVSIRNFIASVYGRRIEHKRNQRRVNRKRRKNSSKKAALKNRRSIEKRPKAANQRQRVGDAEGDFIESGRDGSGKLLVIVDRKLRVVFICQLRKVTVTNLLKALMRVKKGFPEWRTLTFDNDILFAQHERFERVLGITIYFCHPYSSWEKGTVENANKYIRRDIPKGSDVNAYSPQFVRSVEGRLNRRMMKCLNYETPAEVLKNYRLKKQKQHPGGAR